MLPPIFSAPQATAGTAGMVRDLTGAGLLLSLSNRVSHRSSINDNYCVSSVAGSSVNVCVTGKETCFANSVTGDKSCVNVTREELYTKNQDCFVTCKEDNLRTLTVNSCVVNHAHFVSGLPQKKGVIPNYCHLCPEIKHMKGVSCVGQSSSVQNVTNVPVVVPNLPVGARLHQFWKKWAALGISIDSPQRRLHPPFPVPAKFDKGTHSNKLLCKSPQEQLPVGGIASAVRQKCSRVGPK